MTGHDALDWRRLVARLRIPAPGRPALSREEESAWDDLRRRVLRLAQLSIRWYHGLTLDDVDDVALDVTAKLLEPAVLRRLQEATSPAAYIVRALKNRAANLSAARRAHAVLLETFAVQAQGSPASVDLGEPLARALGELSREDLSVIRDRFWGDVSIAEMARTRGISYSAMAVRIFRLINRLRRRLDGDRTG